LVYLGLLVKDLSKTRWSNRYDAIRATIVSYQEIMITLQKLSIADIEYNTFYTILLFLKNLMGSINALIIFLQNPQIDILTAIDIIENTIYLLGQMYDDHASLNAVTEVRKFIFFFISFKQSYSNRFRKKILKN
jgi:hypothetical protein